MSNIYPNDKPKDCRYCYWYSSTGCHQKVCYYQRPKPEKPKTKCTDCPYGKHFPCIGWCTKDILRSIGREV